MSDCRAAISARLSMKIFTVGASMMVMATITTASASMRPENALAGTGARFPSSAATADDPDFPRPLPAFPAPVLVPPPAFEAVPGFEAVPVFGPGPVLVPAAALLPEPDWAPAPGFAGAPLPAAFAPPPRPCAVPAPASWVAGAGRGPPKSAWMTSPPADPAADCCAGGVTLGTLGRRVAMTLL